MPAAGAFLSIAALVGLLWYCVLPFFALDGDGRARSDRIVGSRVAQRGV